MKGWPKKGTVLVTADELDALAAERDALRSRLAEREAEIATNGRHAMRLTIAQLAARLAEAEALLKLARPLVNSPLCANLVADRIDAFLTPAASAYDKDANMLDLTPVGPGRTVDDALTDQPRVCPHYDMVIVNEPGCPDCAADQPPTDVHSFSRSEQAEKVNAHIGPLIDAWDGMATDEKDALSETAPDLAEAIEAIIRQIDTDNTADQPTVSNK